MTEAAQKQLPEVNGLAKPQQTIAVAERQLPTRATPLIPENLPDAWRLSEALARSNIIPAAYQGNPGNVLAAIMLAQELQLSPMLVMREVYFVNDRPSLYAELKMAIVMRDPACEYFKCVKTDAREAIFETRRRGHTAPTVLSYTIEEAKEAGLYPGTKSDSAWRKHPKNMLRWRAIGWLCDMVYPDKVLGLKTREEMEEVVEARRETEGNYSAIPAGVYAPEAPPQESPPTTSPPAQTAEPARSPTAAAEQPKTQPTEKGAPDPVDVLFSDLEGVVAANDLDALAVKGKNLIPKDHPRRQEFGAAVNAARKRIGGAK